MADARRYALALVLAGCSGPPATIDRNVVAPPVTTAPPDASPASDALTRGELTALGEAMPLVPDIVELAGGVQLLYADEDVTPRACIVALSPDRTRFASARCRPGAASIVARKGWAPALLDTGSLDEIRILVSFFEGGSDHAIVGLDGAVLAQGPISDAYLRNGKVVAAVESDDQGRVQIRRPRSTIKVAEGASAVPSVHGGVVPWVVTSRGGDRARALIIPSDPAAPAPPILALGPVAPSYWDTWQHCGTGDDLAVLAIRDQPGDQAPPEAWVWHRHGDRLDLLGHGRSNVLQPRPSCHSDAVTLTWFEAWDGAPAEHRAIIGETRCAAGGCTSRTVTVSVGAMGVYAAAVGDRTLLVWSSADGVDARLAPFDQLATAPTQRLVSTAGAPALEINDLIVRDRAALLVLRDPADAMYPVSIGADGRATAVEVSAAP